MKTILLLAVCSLSIFYLSCNKDNDTKENAPGSQVSVIEFVLYTDAILSGYNNKISLTLSIRSSSNRVIWDSLLPAMKVSDIPKNAQQLVIPKSVPNPGGDILKVGFLYYIEDVGVSWYWDYTDKDNRFKRVEFNFQ